MTERWRRPWLGVSLLIACASCLTTVHPLDAGGTVSISSDLQGPLFAAPTTPTSARQRSVANVSLSMTESGGAAKNAFVDVSITPSGALSLVEVDDTCTVTDGAFRCTGSKDGTARFRVESDAPSAAKTDAKVIVSWSGKFVELPITVAPAGLPADAIAFELILGAAVGTAPATVTPTYHALDCVPHLGAALPTWPTSPRAIPMRVLAGPPPSDPSSVIGAPVTIQALSPEAEISLDADCHNHTAKVALTMDATGETPLVYACFSDIGGDIVMFASSGLAANLTGARKTITVDPEPVLLSVTPVNAQVPLSDPRVRFEVVAFGLLQRPIKMSVRVSATSTGGVFLPNASLDTLPTLPPLTIEAVPRAAGTVRLSATPAAFPTIKCDSADVVVTAN